MLKKSSITCYFSEHTEEYDVDISKNFIQKSNFIMEGMDNTRERDITLADLKEKQWLWNTLYVIFFKGEKEIWISPMTKAPTSIMCVKIIRDIRYSSLHVNYVASDWFTSCFGNITTPILCVVKHTPKWYVTSDHSIRTTKPFAYCILISLL